jgi:hypothetical protein
MRMISALRKLLRRSPWAAEAQQEEEEKETRKEAIMCQGFAHLTLRATVGMETSAQIFTSQGREPRT